MSCPMHKMIVIKMTHKEASDLLEICETVGGNPDGPRKLLDRVSDTLRECGVKQSVARKICWSTSHGYPYVERRGYPDAEKRVDESEMRCTCSA